MRIVTTTSSFPLLPFRNTMLGKCLLDFLWITQSWILSHRYTGYEAIESSWCKSSTQGCKVVCRRISISFASDGQASCYSLIYPGIIKARLASNAFMVAATTCSIVSIGTSTPLLLAPSYSTSDRREDAFSLLLQSWRYEFDSPLSRSHSAQDLVESI
jgi:hypothetical protein